MKTTLGDLLFITLAIRHENAVAQLYRLFAQLMPDGRDFWQRIHNDEVAHAELLSALSAEVRDGRATLNPNRRSAAHLHLSLESLEPRVRSWSMWGVAEREAFRYALLLEDSMIERDYFVPLCGDSEATAEVLTALQRDTALHVDRLRAAAARYTRRRFVSWFCFWRRA